jgi:hypothetical protein
MRTSVSEAWLRSPVEVSATLAYASRSATPPSLSRQFNVFRNIVQTAGRSLRKIVRYRRVVCSVPDHVRASGFVASPFRIGVETRCTAARRVSSLIGAGRRCGAERAVRGPHMLGH